MRMVLVLGSILLLSSCKPSLGKRLTELRQSECPKVLEEYQQIVQEPEYEEAFLGTKRDFDVEAARCWLAWRRPEKAKSLMHKSDTTQWPEGLMILARAYAQLAEDEKAKAIILQLKTPVDVPVEYFWKHPELSRYAAQDWYIATALERWSSASEYSLERAVWYLAQRAGTDLLDLSVAAADTQRPTGEWVVWTGIVRDTRLDRNRNKTVLLVDGMAAKEQLTMVDRKVTSFDQSLSGEVTPEYEEKRTYSEKFVPLDQQFLVELDGVDEQMVGLRAVTVVGRYDGFAGEDLPKVRVLRIIERKLGERTE